MEDGYIQELFKLFRESQYVQPPKKPFSAYERFAGNYEQACKDKNLNHNSDQAKKQWENLEKELKDEYFRLSKKDDELYEKLLRQYHSISNLIKKKKADGSVLFFQEKGVDKGLTNLQQLWDELSIEEKQIYGQKVQQNCEDTIKASIEEYIIDYEHYLNQQNEKPQNLQFVQKIEDEQDEIDQIDIIIGIKRTNGKKEYLVRFKGKTGKDAKWFPKKKLRKVKEIVKEFEDAYFKQSFQDNESSSGFDSTPQEQIFQENERVDKQINNNVLQEDNKIEYIEEEKEEKKKVKVKPKPKQSIKVSKPENIPKSQSPKNVKQLNIFKPKNPEVENKINQTRRSKIVNDNVNTKVNINTVINTNTNVNTNSTPKTKGRIIQEESNKKQQDKIKNQKQLDQFQDDVKQKSKQPSIDKQIIAVKDVQKKKDNVKINQQVLQKRSNKLTNQDNNSEKSINKQVKKQVNEKSNDNKSKSKTPQKKSNSKEVKQIKQQNQSNQSSVKINSKNQELPITKRQGRSRYTLNSEVKQVLNTKLNYKTQKLEIKVNKLSKKQQQVAVQQQTQSNSNRRSKQGSQPKQQKNAQNKQQQQSKQEPIVKTKTRSLSVQSIKVNNKEIQQKNKQITIKKNRSQSEAKTNVTLKSRNSIKTNESSKSLKKVSPINTQSNQQLKKVQQKLSNNQIQPQIGKQQTRASNKNLINAQTSNQQKINTRIGTRNSKINNPIEINKKISKKSIKKQKEKITKKKQITLQVNPKNRNKNQKTIVKVDVRQTRQLRSKKCKEMGKRKH